MKRGGAVCKGGKGGGRQISQGDGKGTEEGGKGLIGASGRGQGGRQEGD